MPNFDRIANATAVPLLGQPRFQ